MYRIKFVGTLHYAPYRAPRICQIFAILMVNKDDDSPTCNQNIMNRKRLEVNNHDYRSNCGFSIRLSVV